VFLRCRKMPNPFRNNDLTADYIFLMERLDPRRVCDSRGVNFPIADNTLGIAGPTAALGKSELPRTRFAGCDRATRG
jgi:hypothetical protein